LPSLSMESVSVEKNDSSPLNMSPCSQCSITILAILNNVCTCLLLKNWRFSLKCQIGYYFSQHLLHFWAQIISSTPWEPCYEKLHIFRYFLTDRFDFSPT
jgi:hypothetical protein